MSAGIRLPDEIEMGPDFWSEDLVKTLADDQPYTVMAKARVARTLALQAATRVALVEGLLDGDPTEVTDPLCELVENAGTPNGVMAFIRQTLDLLEFTLVRGGHILEALRGEPGGEEAKLATGDGPPTDSMLWRAERVESKASSLDYAVDEIRHVLMLADSSSMEGKALADVSPNVGAQLESAIHTLHTVIGNISDVGRSLQDFSSETIPEPASGDDEDEGDAPTPKATAKKKRAPRGRKSSGARRDTGTHEDRIGRG